MISGNGSLVVSGKISAAGDITIKGGKVSVDDGISAGGTVLIRDAELAAGTDETGTAIVTVPFLTISVLPSAFPMIATAPTSA